MRPESSRLVLVADVVGFSRVAGADEERTVARSEASAATSSTRHRRLIREHR